MVGEQLQRDDLQDREQEFVRLGDGDDVFDELFDVVVAFDGDGNHAAAAGGDLLNI